MKRTKTKIAAGIFAAGIFAAAAVLCVFFAYCGVKSAAFAEKIAAIASTEATAAVGTEVSVGGVSVDSFDSVTIENVKLFDRQTELIAAADTVAVRFSLLSALKNSPVAAIDKVCVNGVSAFVVEREDGSINVEDIDTGESGENDFRGTVEVADAKITGRDARGNEIVAEDAAAELDFSAAPAMKFSASATLDGADVTASGTFGQDLQTANIDVENVDAEKYVSLLPEGTLPDNVEIVSGKLKKGSVNVLRRYDTLSLSGDAKYEGGAVRIEDALVENIAGTASFTDSTVLLAADAESAGQKAHINGSVRFDLAEPLLNLTASSDSFDPGAVLPNIPFTGAADFRAQVTGTVANPSVVGDFHVANGVAEGVPFSDAACHAKLVDNVLYVQNFSANVFDGKATGEGELSLSDLSYNAHLKTDAINAAHAADYLPQAEGLTGFVAADLGINGKGADLSAMKIYGSAAAKEANWRGFKINGAAASFFVEGKDVVVDYLSIKMPNRSDIGIEGSIVDGRIFDLSFYGGHVDFSLLKNLIPQADVTGLGDFKGSVKGSVENPAVDIRLSALHGTLFKQPFDSLKASAAGSLDGLQIEEFVMEKGGKETWIVTGSVGFSGEKRIDLRADTIGARCEELAARVAPDQPITGNVDNTIRFTGTLDNPHAVGYVHFYRGSYRGVLLSGMDGDYYIDGDDVRLQDFHIYSPMVDMDVNGIINRSTTAISMTVAVHDIDMKRFEDKFPYAVEGHGVFDGRIGGTLDSPSFFGTLEAPSLTLNGVKVEGVNGKIDYGNDMLRLRKFEFKQDTGDFDFTGSMNTATEKIAGKMSVESADINSLLVMLNQNNDIVGGKLTSEINFGGTLGNPSLDIAGSIDEGTAAGYSIHDVALALNLNDGVLAINTLQGAEGESGHFEATGTIDLDGPIDANFTASGLELGMFTHLAGLSADVIGTADITASFGGFVSNPSADVNILARDGGVKGSTFDSMTGNFSLKNGLVDVKELVVEKVLAEQNYKASAHGIVPLKAIFATSTAELNDYEQIKLAIALDNANLSLLPVVSDHVEWALGATKGNVEITGTLARPSINGEISVPDGAMKIKEINNPVTDMKFKLLFSGHTAELTECSGKMGGGNYDVKGRVALDGLTPINYNFDLELNALDISSKLYNGPLTANFRLDEGQIFNRTLPRLTGKIFFENCTAGVPSIPETEGGMPDMIIDVGIDVGKNVRVYSSYLCDMYLAGTAHFGGTTRHPRPSGSVSVKKGTVNYLKTVFKIREGEAYFNQVDSFLPSITFFADTKLTKAKVFLYLNGPLDKIDLRLGSSPEMSQTEIIKLLTLRNAYKDGDTEMGMGDILSVGLQMSFMSEVEDVVRNYLFLDTFSVSRGSGSAFDNDTKKENDVYNIEMGKYISDRVQVHYVQGIGEHLHRYGVQYDFNDRMSMTIDRESGKYIFGVEARIKF